jgi:hypothetical protein
VTRREAMSRLGISHAQLTTFILAFRAEIKREAQHLIHSFKGRQ